MSIKATVLRESRHREFLQAQRQDPVTHRVFTVGDRVTRCANCLLPFLDQSWQAIGATHCGQFASITLDNSEPSPTEGDPAAAIPDPREVRPEPKRLELMPIPIALREVPISLR